MSTNYDTHTETAEEFFREGKYDAACAASLKALECEHEADDVRAQLILGRAYLEMGMEEEGLEVLEEVLKRIDDYAAMGAMVRHLAAKAHFDEITIQRISRLVEEAPDNPDGFIASYEYHVHLGEYRQALEQLKRGLRRGAEYPFHVIFERVQSWAQDLCNAERYEDAFVLSHEVTDYFSNLEFFLLNARLAELAERDRDAVHYYKKTLIFLRPGKLRNEVLETIATLAI